MSGFNSCLDDLKAIRKRREELFPKVGVPPEEPFVQPMTATEVVTGQEQGKEDFGSYNPSQMMKTLPELRALNAAREAALMRCEGCQTMALAGKPHYHLHSDGTYELIWAAHRSLVQ